MKEIKIKTEYITISQFLKYVDAVPSGGIVKAYLQEGIILVNGEVETRRGRKCYSSDLVEVTNGESYKII